MKPATTDSPTAASTIQARIDALPPGDDWAVQAVQLLLESGQALGCSDLHILCQRDSILVRGRREGDFVPFATLPLRHRDMLIGRLKIIARLPAFIRHEPQDGRIEWEWHGRLARDSSAPPRTLRISFLPTLHGENVVIRFPEREIDLALDCLGMEPELLAAVRQVLARPEGTILLTGPSSSGKTSTIYAMLTHLHAVCGDRLHFLTLEDPVERDLGFAGQVQVDEAKGLTFERALRATLRQDPNVLMIGEIRDLETARTALQAGMTGHRVLSTLHAGRSSLVFSRLLSLGVSRYLVASALTGVLAQRLVRRLCPHCRVQEEWHGRLARECADHGRDARATTECYTAPGCAACDGTGHEGRTGIFEWIQVGESLRTGMLADAPPEQIAAAAARVRVGSLPRQARHLVEQGIIDRREYENLFSGEEEMQ